jgi:hypothetical protein
MPALKKFNRGPRTKNLNSWPDGADAVSPRKATGMGPQAPGKVISKSTGGLTTARPPAIRQKYPKVPK